MATTTITGLPNATTPLTGTERVPMDQAGTTVDATTQAIADLKDADPSGTAAAAITAHEAAADPHPTYLTDAEGSLLYAPASQGVTNGNSHDHNGGDGGTIAYSSLSGTPTLGGAAALNVGTTAGTVAAGDDARFHDSVSLAASVEDVLGLTGQQITADDPGADRIVFWDDSESKLTHLSLSGGLSISGATLSQDNAGAKVEICIACSDETSNLVAGAAKVTFRMPFAMTLTAVRASVNTAPTGSTLIVDINEGSPAVSVLGTALSIDAGEFTSLDATSEATITDSALANDAIITIDLDQIGATIAGAGLKVWLIGTRA